MYKILVIKISPDIDTLLLTEDMICQKFNIKKHQFRKSINKLIENGIIYSVTEYKTSNVEIYQAVLNQDYDAINRIADEI